VPVQVHRMRHSCLIDHYQLYAFVLGDRQWRDILVPRDVVDRPDVARHVPGQVQRVHTVCLMWFQWLGCAQLALEIKRQSGRWRAGGLGDAGYCRAAGGQHDAGPASVAFQHGEHRMGGRLAGKRKPDVEPLRDGYWEATAIIGSV